jgi:hypothetical protein
MILAVDDCLSLFDYVNSVPISKSTLLGEFRQSPIRFRTYWCGIGQRSEFAVVKLLDGPDLPFANRSVFMPGKAHWYRARFHLFSRFSRRSYHWVLHRRDGTCRTFPSTSLLTTKLKLHLRHFLCCFFNNG